jgi:hypothetical protein
MTTHETMGAAGRREAADRLGRIHLPFPARSRTVEPTNGDAKREAS